MSWTSKQFSILSLVAITSFMGTFLISSINIALPSIEKSFELDAVTLSWVVTAFLLSMALLLLPAGRWGDLTGIRRLFKTGVILFTLSSVLCALSPSGLWLIGFRFVQGAGAAFTSTTGPAILVSAFPPRQRGSVLGMSVSAVYLGLAFGPFVGGILTQSLGWRSIFYVSALLGIGLTIITHLFLGKDMGLPDTTPKKVNLKGLFYYTIGLTTLLYGSSTIPRLSGWLLITAGFLALLVFWKTEAKNPNPVIPTTLFTKNRLFAFSNLAALINYSATFAIVFLLSLYLQKIQNMSPRQAGMILVAQPLMMAFFSPVAGHLSDKIQPRLLATLGMTMCTLGLAALSFLGPVTSIAFLVFLLVWMGLGFAFFSSPNMNTIMSSVDKTKYGLASGTAATMRVVGQIASMTIVTSLFALLFNGKSVETIGSSTFLTAMRYGFLTFSIISMAGIYFSYNRGTMKRE
ncbi:MFS transporter [Thermophagus sp. OGC60D27]|uniref:MFS transporter n=1 Tax=Thermophagus sp. OGC60D27 TaxID=3458415 RepID=UPI0040382BAA